ncbi:alpha-L-rhamnosidase N-terminal domain-containing protein [Streptomyces sp. L7]
MPQHSWTAQVISPRPRDHHTPAPPAALLRTDFTVRREVRSAWLLATALGVYELELNGTTVGDLVLDPRLDRSYDHRPPLPGLRRHASLLRPGANAWGALLADGWCRGLLGFNGGTRDLYGPQHRPSSPNCTSSTPTAPPTPSSPAPNGARATAR